MGSSFLTKELLSHCEASFSLRSFLPLESSFPTEKLPSYWEDRFPLRSFLPTGKLLYHWEAFLPLGSSFPTEKLPSYWEAPFPLRSESFLPTWKLPYHWEAFLPLGSCLSTGKLSYHCSGKLPSLCPLTTRKIYIYLLPQRVHVSGFLGLRSVKIFWKSRIFWKFPGKSKKFPGTLSTLSTHFWIVST